jgi:glyoxylase-like metal-dependent hydrolase (beta-lactamase superfamily II)
MKKKLLLGAAASLFVALTVVYFTLVSATYAPEACTYDLDLAQLRALAASMPGDKPQEIRVEHITSTDFPKHLVCPGQPWESVQFRVYSYQLVFSNETIVVDSAMNREQAEAIGMTDGYDEAAWQRLAKALRAASAVYVTHEHADHMGGAVADDTWAANVRLTPLQLDSDVPSRPDISPVARGAMKTVTYNRYAAVAPGVVLIAALGHTPGSQMVFVTRADGREVIFTGDTAWLMDNIEHEQGPAKFITTLMGSNRNETSCQLAALKRIHEREPNVSIMPGHDERRMQMLLDKGIFAAGFK